VTVRLLCGDALEQLRLLSENSVDAVVTDPPYGLSFMGKDWDHGIPGEAFWCEALRVAKPGAHLLAFGGTRTFHRLACAIEDAGWEMRDSVGLPHRSGEWGDCPWLLAWVYGSGFPKSKNVGSCTCGTETAEHTRECESIVMSAWRGWGTALKPAWEPIILARKPLEWTVAENVQKWGTGALNIVGCRINPAAEGDYDHWRDPDNIVPHAGFEGKSFAMGRRSMSNPHPAGRWPANLIHDGSDEVVGLFPQAEVRGSAKSGMTKTRPANPTGLFGGLGGAGGAALHNDSGSAARFFYCAKASRAEREEGLDGTPERLGGMVSNTSGQHLTRRDGGAPGLVHNNHPTVKPIDLMRYLCRLVTPPGGTVLDPFMGSGSTGKAAMLEGFGFIGIDNVPEYVEIARRRIEGTAPLFAEVWV
jgi:site-specific DNA-methyltransferase (adenine-specific)